MKLRSLAAVMTAFALSSGIAYAQTSTAASSSAQPSDKALLSYAIGYDMARDLAERNVDLDVNTLLRAIQDGYAKRTPTMPGDKLAAALESFQKRMAEQQRAKFDEAVRENTAKSQAFLTANRSKPGVTVLPDGVQYRVIEPGTGPKPTASNTVDAHLRGSISTGQEFANTYQSANAQPATFKVGEFPIAGVREALMMMPMGSRWEIYVPAEQAYANDPRSPIGPAQAVVFDIKLISVK
jgi:FKBP-type peptidyl-prolyl cis-trans isomerase